MDIKGNIINGRKYSAHSLERMAPGTLEVKAELSSRAHNLAIKKGLQPRSEKYYSLVKSYIVPRNIPPMVIEDNIKNGVKTISRENTFMYIGNDIKVITNQKGDVITVIPK
ncbi:hypothetical protein [Avibacterium avium]|uniref:hypothetical protein n=1 Tax=Avibacterium avium TaxID=751 RepID=UPI0039FD2318